MDMLSKVGELKHQLKQSSHDLDKEKAKRKALVQEKVKRQHQKNQGQVDELKKQLKASQQSATSAVQASTALQTKFQKLQDENKALAAKNDKGKKDRKKLATLETRVNIMK